MVKMKQSTFRSEIFLLGNIPSRMREKQIEGHAKITNRAALVKTNLAEWKSELSARTQYIVMQLSIRN